MSVVEELIRKEDNGTLSFGNYLLDTKTKKADFPFEGASYKIKTFNEITRLEKNGTMVYADITSSGSKAAAKAVASKMQKRDMPKGWFLKKNK